MELTDWISALSSVASLAVAIFAAAIAWIVHRREATRLKEAKRAAERSQADLVTAWETAYPVPADQLDEVPEGALSEAQISDYGTYVYATRLVMTLVNRSNQPVYDVRINTEGSESVITLEILPPSEQQVGVPRYAVTDYSVGDVNRNEYLLNISFRDVAGNWWVRKAKGALIKVTSETEHDAAMGEIYEDGQRRLRLSLAEHERLGGLSSQADN